MPKTVINSYVATLIDSVCQRGVRREDLLAGAGFAHADLASPNVRIRQTDLTRLWHQALLLTQDPHLGLHVGACAQLGTLNVLAPVVMNCPTLDQVLDYLPQFAPLVSEAGTFSLVRSPQGCDVLFDIVANDPPLTHHQVDAIFATMVVLGKQLTGSDALPASIEFQHALGADPLEYQRILGCPVMFGRRRNALRLNRAQLQMPIRLADPSQLDHHAELLQRRLRALHQSKAVAERVLGLISRMPSSEWSPARVAALMEMPLRSLQRALRQEGTSYQTLLDHFRQQQSRKLLLTTGLSIADIAERLGYLNLSSYHRAFQRWFGTTPTDLRTRG